jgi:hypothetical protein
VTSDSVKRRLTTILAADVAGYSRLVGVDEEGTLVQWKAHWSDLIEPKQQQQPSPAGPFFAVQAVMAPFLATFKDYPPSQRPSSFGIDQLIEKMQRSLEPPH